MDFFGFFHQQVEIVAKELDGHVAADAGDHFVEPHFDRLGHGDPLAGQIAQRSPDQLGQFILSAGPFPLAAGLERDEHVGQFDAHRVGGHFGAADAAPDGLHFVGKMAEDGPFHLRVVADRLFQAGSGQANHVDGDGPFGELGHELAAQVGGNQPEANEQHAHGEPKHGPLVVHGEVEHGPIGSLQVADEQRFAFFHSGRQHQAGQHGHEGERKNHRPGQGEDDRQRHGTEQLPFHSGQREDGQIDDHDD